MTADRDLDIGEVARRTGLTPSALRYYERRGLIEPSGRAGLRRQYASDVLDRLGLIVVASEAGFRLEEIRALLGARHRNAAVMEGIRRKSDEIGRRIEALTAVRDNLRHASRCTSPRLLDCPRFRDYVRRVMMARCSDPG